MATKLNNQVKRELQFTQYRHKGKLRNIIVTITPAETLQFRVKGTFRIVEIGLAHCLNLAEIRSVDSDYKYEMQKYKAGIRKRKPRKKYYPYSEIYFKAIETVK